MPDVALEQALVIKLDQATVIFGHTNRHEMCFEIIDDARQIPEDIQVELSKLFRLWTINIFVQVEFLRVIFLADPYLSFQFCWDSFRKFAVREIDKFVTEKSKARYPNEFKLSVAELKEFYDLLNSPQYTYSEN